MKKVVSSKQIVDARMTKEPPVTFQVSVIVPILEPSAFDYNWFKHFKPSVVSAISELTQFTTSDLRLTDYTAENLCVRIREGSKNRKARTLTIGGHEWPRLPCVDLEWSVQLTLTDFRIERNDGKPIPLSERVSLCAQIASESFAEAVSSILMASQIAQPGVLRTHELEIWVDERFLKTTDRILGYLGEIVEFAGEKAWPKIESLSIKQVWQWMCCFDPLSDNLGQSEIGRALNALTYVLSENQSRGATLWI
jgi:hypothetical protein